MNVRYGSNYHQFDGCYQVQVRYANLLECVLAPDARPYQGQ